MLLHLEIVEQWERKRLPPPPLLDPFLQLTKQPACETELSMVTLGPLQTRDLVSDTEKVLPVFQVHQVQLGSFSAPELISVHEHEYVHEQVIIRSLAHQSLNLYEDICGAMTVQSWGGFVLYLIQCRPHLAHDAESGGMGGHCMQLLLGCFGASCIYFSIKSQNCAHSRQRAIVFAL